MKTGDFYAAIIGIIAFVAAAWYGARAVYWLVSQEETRMTIAGIGGFLIGAVVVQLLGSLRRPS